MSHTQLHIIYTKTSLLNADNIHIHSVSHYSVEFFHLFIFLLFSIMLSHSIHTVMCVLAVYSQCGSTWHSFLTFMTWILDFITTVFFPVFVCVFCFIIFRFGCITSYSQILKKRLIRKPFISFFCFFSLSIPLYYVSLSHKYMALLLVRRLFSPNQLVRFGSLFHKIIQ